MKPNLHRPLGHVDFLRNALSGCGSRRRVFVELYLQGNQLILCRSLPFLVLLLLGESALARRPPCRRGGRCGWCGGDGFCWRRSRCFRHFRFHVVVLHACNYGLGCVNSLLRQLFDKSSRLPAISPGHSNRVEVESIVQNRADERTGREMRHRSSFPVREELSWGRIIVGQKLSYAAKKTLGS